MESSAEFSWRERGTWRRRASFLLLVLAPSLWGCEKKSPPDLKVQEGFRLLESDPKTAYESLRQAKNQDDPEVLLGQGLALERLRKYEEAEALFVRTAEKTNGGVPALPLARVRIILGKSEEASKIIDRIVADIPTELSALLLLTCLANDENRARDALSRLEKWEGLANDGKTTPSRPPSEFYLSKKVLLAQLAQPKDVVPVAKKAAATKLSDERSAFALVELAVKSGRRDLAIELLRKLNDEDAIGKNKEHIAKLAHGLEDHRLVESILRTLTGSSPEILALQAEHKFATGYPQADVPLRRALGAVKDDGSRERLGAMLVEALLRSEKPEEARKEAELLAEKHPSPGASVLLARADLAVGEPKQSLERLKPLLTEKDPPPAAREVAALAQLELGRTQLARDLLIALLADEPQHLRAAELVTSLELKAQRPKEAVRIARELHEKRPDDVGLLLLLAETERRSGGIDAAISVLTKATEGGQRDPRVWVTLAQILESKKDDVQALSLLEKAHESMPSSNMITLALATRLARAGDTKRAASLYEALIQDAQEDPVALNNLAMLYADTDGHAERAVKLAEKAHQMSPAPGIIDTLGWALFKRGKKDDHARALELLSSVQPKLTSPTSKFHLGAVQIATGEVEKGKLLIRQALAQGGDFPEAEQARALLSSIP